MSVRVIGVSLQYDRFNTCVAFFSIFVELIITSVLDNIRKISRGNSLKASPIQVNVDVCSLNFFKSKEKRVFVMETINHCHISATPIARQGTAATKF